MKHIPALIAIQSELKVPKNRKNNFGGFAYRNASDILEAVKPLLSKYKSQLVLSDEMIHVGNWLVVSSTAYFTCLEDEVQSVGFAMIDLSKKGMDDAQKTGSASSYARKYALCGLFLIDDAIDPDSLPTMPDNGQPVPPPPGNLAPAPGNPRVPSIPSTPSIPSSSRAAVPPPPPPGVLRKNP